MKNRYEYLFDAVAATGGNSRPHKSYRILMIGVYDGVRFRDLINKAVALGRTTVEAYGFDLFAEDWTEEKNKQEFGKAKPPAKAFDAATVIESAKGKPQVHLYRGDSTVTLPQQVGTLPPMDLIFVDGGHSCATIASDVTYALRVLAPKGVMLLDDYYAGVQSEGCLRVTEALKSRDYLTVEVLPHVDEEAGGKTIQLVVVRKCDMPAPADDVIATQTASNVIDKLRKLAEALPVVENHGEIGAAVSHATANAIERLRALPRNTIQPDPTVYAKVNDSEQLLVDNPAPVWKDEGEKTSSPPADQKAWPSGVGSVAPFPPVGGGDHPDLQPVQVRAAGGLVGIPAYAEAANHLGRRRQPGLESEPVARLPVGIPDSGEVPEKRSEPDPVVEPRSADCPGSGSADDGGGE